MTERFEDMLTGGHPNSLGRTVEVVGTVLGDPSRMTELFECYGSGDEVVHLRTSSAIKRIEEARRDLVLPFVDRMISEIGELDQASAQWTLATLFGRMKPVMTAAQQVSALALMKRNLLEHRDWIVLNTTMEVLTGWSADDSDLKAWLKPHLDRLKDDPRKSVSGRATKMIAKHYRD